ncbi:hypothetical protein L1606_04425 [Streptomyces spororaveus]|uniref:hypothetical protein n=1 Tax=Streptomyces spororaveus TaxID=284039 RepID=UPI00207ACA2E|nr:hypothetical protein [Streptomyces spororaveus]MCM9077341.1 hypothetical protein [Streptomyces spororaveus]
MDLLLTPPTAAGPVHLGSTYEEAVAALQPWGEPRVVGPTSRRARRLMGDVDGVGYTVFFDAEDHVTAVELWWPGEGRRSTTRVLLDGHDVFADPADTILAELTGRGATVDIEDPENIVVPGVSLGFTRQTSQEVPRGPHGLPVSFTSVLVAGKDYYDFRDAQ